MNFKVRLNQQNSIETVENIVLASNFVTTSAVVVYITAFWPNKVTLKRLKLFFVCMSIERLITSF